MDNRLAEIAARAAAIEGLAQGIDLGMNLALTGAPIGNTRIRVSNIIATLRKDGYLPPAQEEAMTNDHN